MRIVFEGLPGSGKTTVCDHLSKTLNYPMVAEFGGLSYEYWTNFKLQTPFYRVNDELKEYIGSKFSEGCIFFDRHYVGTLAYAYALTYVGKHTCDEGECYQEEFEWYQKAMNLGTLKPPDLTIVLDIPAHLSVARKPSAKQKDAIWGGIDYLEAMRIYYEAFFQYIEMQTPVLFIDAQQNPSCVINTIVSHLDSLKISG